jgi:hypothetical protein
MVRLAVLRASITLWKRAISISDLLKPSTWKRLAIVQAMLAVTFFGLYLTPGVSEQEIPPVHITDVRPQVPLTVVAPQISIIGREHLAVSQGQSFNLSINGSNFDAAVSVDVEFLNATSSANAIWGSMDSSYWMFVGGHSMAQENRYLARGITNPTSESAASLPSPPNSANKSPVVTQMRPPPQMSLLQTAQAAVLLTQGVFMTIGSIFASVFGWVGYRRGKADLLLKQLQVRELQLKVEKMERDRERELEEITKSGIILCS